MKFYTHVSGRYAPFHSKVIAANASEAAHILDGLLHHECSLDIREHYTDTAGAIDHVFGLCHLLGFRFAPRIRDLADRRLYVADVDIDAHYYSVPYRFARAEVEARLTACGIEIFHKGERIAVHLGASGNRKHTTVPEHMPSSHRRYAGWTIERIREDRPQDRPGDRSPVRADPGGQAPSRAELSRLSRHRPPRQLSESFWNRARSRLRAAR